MKALPLLLLACFAVPSHAQPDMSRQGSWGDKEKKEFLEFLKSGRTARPTGDVKDVGAPPSLRAAPRRARYLTLAAVSDSVYPVDPSDRESAEPAGFGGKLLLGGHLFSWVRYYAGVQATPLKQRRLDGTRAALNHVQVPAGIELALIPLGTPHTRYVLLRAGASLHHVDGEETEFAAPITGWRTAWNLGLGYEWQIPDTRVRLHLLPEGYRSTGVKDGTRFSGLGGTAGLAFTF